MFIDNTLLFLEGNRDNMDMALTVITMFGATFGAKLNLHKYVGLWLAHTEKRSSGGGGMS